MVDMWIITFLIRFYETFQRDDDIFTLNFILMI